MDLLGVSSVVRAAARPLRGLGPYAAMELILPGGTLIALAYWAYRHRASLHPRVRRILLAANRARGGSGTVRRVRDRTP